MKILFLFVLGNGGSNVESSSQKADKLPKERTKFGKSAENQCQDESEGSWP